MSPAVSSMSHDPWQPRFRTPDFGNLNPKDVHVVSQLWPMDSYNTTLLNHVHPPEWQDPKANNADGSSTYDLVVVGGGAGGLISAAGSAGVGAKVALIEENMLGGDWLVHSDGFGNLYEADCFLASSPIPPPPPFSSLKTLSSV